MMNRRSFLRSLLVAVAVATAPPVLRRVLSDAHVPQLLVAQWFQTTRMTECYSDEYTKAIEDILRGSPNGLNYLKKYRE